MMKIQDTCCTFFSSSDIIKYRKRAIP